MRCKIFNCDKVRKSQCCAGCPRRSRCKNPCLNSPERCGQTRQETVRELILEHGIKEVTFKDASAIIVSRQPRGLFYRNLGIGLGYIGIDNRTGDAWTEEFTKLDPCIRWLASEAPREEFEA